jgi:hypothetical protein
MPAIPKGSRVCSLMPYDDMTGTILHIVFSTCREFVHEYQLLVVTFTSGGPHVAFTYLWLETILVNWKLRLRSD